MKYLLSIALLFMGIAVQGQTFWVEAPNDRVTLGVENYIYVRVDGVPCGSMQVRSDNGKIKKTADCKYLLIPQRGGITNISVSKVVGNNVIDLGYRALPTLGYVAKKSGQNNDTYYSFKKNESVKDLSTPTVKPEVLFAGKNSGVLRKSVAELQLGLILDKKYVMDISKIRIASYNVVIQENDMVLFSKYLKSPTFDEEVKTAIKEMKPGCQLIFREIQCILPNNAPMQLAPLSFDIKP